MPNSVWSFLGKCLANNKFQNYFFKWFTDISIFSLLICSKHKSLKVKDIDALCLAFFSSEFKRFYIILSLKVKSQQNGNVIGFILSYNFMFSTSDSEAFCVYTENINNHKWNGN